MPSNTLNEVSANSLAESAHRTLNEATEKAHRTVDRAATATPPLVERAASTAHEVIDTAAGAAQRTVDSVGSTAERLRQMPAQYADTFVEGVRQNPWAAIGIAVLVGFVLGRATD